MTYGNLAEAAKQRAIDHNYEPPKELIEALSQKADKNMVCLPADMFQSVCGTI